MSNDTVTLLQDFIDNLYEDIDLEAGREVFLSVEMSSGEGVVIKTKVPEEFPIYERIILSADWDDVDHVKAVIESLAEDPNVFNLTHETFTGKFISLHAAPSWQTDDDYIDADYSKAMEIAVEKGHQVRIVMEDGLPREITPDLKEDRVNLHMANGAAYRAEFY